MQIVFNLNITHVALQKLAESVAVSLNTGRMDSDKRRVRLLSPDSRSQDSME